MLKRTLAQVELQQSRTANNAKLSPRIVIPFPAPLVERSYFSSLGCICRHNTGKHSCAMKMKVVGRLCCPRGQLSPVRMLVMMPISVRVLSFPGVCRGKWVLRALLRTVKRCRVGPWPIVPLLKRTTAWTCLMKESSTVAAWAESQWKFCNYGGKDLATLNTRLVSIWSVGLVVETFDRLWVSTPFCGV